MTNRCARLLVLLFLLCGGAVAARAQRIPEAEERDIVRSHMVSTDFMHEMQFEMRMQEAMHVVLSSHTIDNLVLHTQPQPTKMQRILGAGLLTFALLSCDDLSARRSQRLYVKSHTHRQLSDAFVFMGDGAPHLGLAGAIGLFGWWTSDHKALRTATRMARAIIGTGLVIQTFKRIAGRQRPSHATHPKGRWNPFPNQRVYNRNIPAFDAFPSGHVATTTATLTVLMESYREATWLRPVSYAIIGMVGFGLANSGMHWYSDFPLGIIVGHLIGELSTHTASVLDEEPASLTTPSLMVNPLLTEGRVGVELQITF